MFEIRDKNGNLLANGRTVIYKPDKVDPGFRSLYRRRATITGLGANGDVRVQFGPNDAEWVKNSDVELE